jgi:hypothetical protein
MSIPSLLLYPAATEERIPPSVDELDQALNRLIAESRTNADLDRRLRTKARIKRQIVDLPSEELDTAARRLLLELTDGAY